MKKPRINNQIISAQLRVVDEEGKNLGVLSAGEALAMAKEKGLDLIEISPMANPPVAKIIDFGKFMYKEKRSERAAGKIGHETETKEVKVHMGTSEHDLALKAKKASEFLKEGHRLKVELLLRGREKYMDKNFLRGRLYRILNLLTENYKVSGEPKSGPRGMYIMVEKSK